VVVDSRDERGGLYPLRADANCIGLRWDTLVANVNVVAAGRQRGTREVTGWYVKYIIASKMAIVSIRKVDQNPPLGLET
jgi:hypothetical protein